MSNKTKILLVEDEATLAVIVRDTLKSQGFEVLTADNGERGLQLFFHERPDVVVADVMMPNMDGFEMVRRIRMSPHRCSFSQPFQRLRMW